MRKLLAAFAVAAALIATPVFAQQGVAKETKEGSESPEGGAYGAGADVNESEARGIINWWSWDYDTGGHHAKDPAHKGWPPPFGFALINFGIFLAIMSRLAWKPLKQYMSDRHDEIAKNLDEAAKLRAEAEKTLKQYEEKIGGIDREIDTLLAQIKKEAEAEKARIIATAEADAKRLKEDAERQIAAEIDRARRELRRGVIEAAVGAAEDTLKKNIGADDQRKMAEKYVADVEARAKAGEALVITGSLARRYAKALLEIGVAHNNFDSNGKELDRAADTLRSSGELRVALENPIFSIEKRKLIMDELVRRLGVSKTVRNFIMLLLDKGRIASLPDIARAHRALVDEHAGRVRATVTSARPLDPLLETRLKTALEKSSGKTVIFEKREDPAILGGLVTQVGDTVYDGSVRTQLQSLREELLTE